jgi:cellulose biosynthesis protein BcsQ
MPSGSRSLRLCVYNYKGGAAKTTIVVNTAAAIAHPDHGNKKTLLVDLDPQCNSTQFYHDDWDGRTLKKEEIHPSAGAAAARR